MATLFRRGKTFWLRDGKHRESLHTRKREIAKALVTDYEGRKLRPGKYLRLKDAIDKYLEYCKPANKPSSYIDKKRVLENFRKHAGDLPISQITTETHVEGYLKTRDHLSPYRWNTERQVINGLFNWAVDRNYYAQANPVKVIHIKKEPRGKAADILTRAEIQKVYLAIGKHADIADAFQAALNGGFRIQEIENQTISDLDLANGIIRVRAHDDGWTPKGYEARVVPLNSAMMKLYARRLKKVQGLSPFLFPNAFGGKHGKDWVTFLCRAMRRAGIEHGGWHRTRHTFATSAVKNGMDFDSLRKVMGISDNQTLLKYVHVSDDYRERVRKKMPNL